MKQVWKKMKKATNFNELIMNRFNEAKNLYFHKLPSNYFSFSELIFQALDERCDALIACHESKQAEINFPAQPEIIKHDSR